MVFYCRYTQSGNHRAAARAQAASFQCQSADSALKLMLQADEEACQCYRWSVCGNLHANDTRRRLSVLYCSYDGPDSMHVGFCGNSH